MIFEGNQDLARHGTNETTEIGATERHYIAGVDGDSVYNEWRGTFALLVDAIAYRDKLNQDSAP